MTKIKINLQKDFYKKSAECDFYLDSDGLLYKCCRFPSLYKKYARAFHEEITAMTYLQECFPNNPYFPKYVDYGILNGAPCICMEYIKGVTLEDYLQKRSQILHTSGGPSLSLLAKPQRDKILYQLYEAAKMLYECHIIHFDINPSNIFIINDQFDIKLIDFTFFYNLNKSEEENKRERYKRNDSRLSKDIPTSLRMANALLFFYVQSFFPCKENYEQHSPDKTALYRFFSNSVSPDCARLIRTMFFQKEDISSVEWTRYETASNPLFRLEEYLDKLLRF